MGADHGADRAATGPPRRWPAEVLAAIDEADDLKVSPLRSDGVTLGTPTWVWCVTVDGELYVRGYHGTASRWYSAAMARPDGRISAAGRAYDVTFEPAPTPVDDRIDDAYRAKYPTNPFLRLMIGPRARAAGVRIRPRT